MAYKSMRQRMFESATKSAASTLDEDLTILKKRAAMQNYMAVKVRDSIFIANCYLCGTKNNVKEILYGNKFNNNVLLLCPECKKWFGEVLISDKTEITKKIEEE